MIGLGTGLGKLKGSSSWTPAKLAPFFWLDATQLGLANGDLVSSWTDLSGNGNNFTSSGTARPTFTSSGINGLPSLTFDGNSDGMILSSVPAHSSWWFFMVGQLVSFSATANVVSIDDYAPDGKYIMLQLNSATALGVNSNAGYLSSFVSAGIGTKRGYCFKGSSSGATLKADDGTIGTSSSNFSKALSNMRLGRRGDGFFSNYRFGETVYGVGTLTSDQESSICQYFNKKWGTLLS